MVSAKENTNFDDLVRPQPITIKAPPACYQDGGTFRKARFDCLECDFFDQCKL